MIGCDAYMSLDRIRGAVIGRRFESRRRGRCSIALVGEESRSAERCRPRYWWDVGRVTENDEVAQSSQVRGSV